MMQENDLRDIYRIRNRMKSASLGDAKIHFCRGGLIIFISDFLQDLVETADILPSVQSDHSTLKFNFLLSMNGVEVRLAGSSIIH